MKCIVWTCMCAQKHCSVLVLPLAHSRQMLHSLCGRTASGNHIGCDTRAQRALWQVFPVFPKLKTSTRKP